MAADEAQMAAEKSMTLAVHIAPVVARSPKHMSFICVHLRFICGHLRSCRNSSGA